MVAFNRALVVSRLGTFLLLFFLGDLAGSSANFGWTPAPLLESAKNHPKLDPKLPSSSADFRCKPKKKSQPILAPHTIFALMIIRQEFWGVEGVMPLAPSCIDHSAPKLSVA